MCIICNDEYKGKSEKSESVNAGLKVTNFTHGTIILKDQAVLSGFETN